MAETILITKVSPETNYPLPLTAVYADNPPNAVKNE